MSPLSERHSLSLALAVNELATNAVKYGALSVQPESYPLTGRLARPASCDEFRFSWVERNGPAVTRTCAPWLRIATARADTLRGFPRERADHLRHDRRLLRAATKMNTSCEAKSVKACADCPFSVINFNSNYQRSVHRWPAP